jgi:hypothetical protein
MGPPAAVELGQRADVAQFPDADVPVGHGRQFVKHPAVQLDLLRLGQRQGR